MKVTVADNFLHERSGSPRLDAPARIYLTLGDVIEVEDNLYKGDQYDDIDTWYKAVGTSNYYWSGGVSQDNLGSTIFYNSFLKQFDLQALQTQGDHTSVMVIDEGMVLDPIFFDTSKIQGINIDPGPISTPHGNFIGGILAGRSAVIGLIPKAKLISLKYTANTTPPDQFLNHLVTALQRAATNTGATIVNLSQSFNKYTMQGNEIQKARIIAALQQIAIQPNKFVICSAGDNGSINNNLFPAHLPECISVGSFDGENADIIVPATLNILSPMVNFRSFDLGFNVDSQAGSSFATAVVSALASCIISKQLPAVITKSELLNALKMYQTNRSQFLFGNLSSFQYQIT